MLFRLVGLNITMDKNGCDLNVFIRMCRSLLKILIMIADLESFVILNKEKYDQCNKQIFIRRQ